MIPKKLIALLVICFFVAIGIGMLIQKWLNKKTISHLDTQLKSTALPEAIQQPILSVPLELGKKESFSASHGNSNGHGLGKGTQYFIELLVGKIDQEAIKISKGNGVSEQKTYHKDLLFSVYNKFSELNKTMGGSDGKKFTKMLKQKILALDKERTILKAPVVNPLDLEKLIDKFENLIYIVYPGLSN